MMDSKTESTVVVGAADANQRNGNHTDVDSDELTCNPSGVENANTSKGFKGFGLKKWRRIRRKDVMISKEKESGLGSEKEKDYDSDSTAGRMLKRVLNLNENENENKSSPSPFPLSTDDNNLAAAAAAAFNVGADSDNSEDSHSHSHSHNHNHSHRSSSKSSAAASYPKFPLRSSSTPRDKHRFNNNVQPTPTPTPSILNLNPPPQPDPSKKPRESSPVSSMESDSRSSTFPAPNPSTFDQQPQPQPQHQQLPPALSSDSSDHCDPLVHSIFMLQSAQHALQTEVQKFGEIGKGICSFCDDSDKTTGVPVPSVSVDSSVYVENASDGWSEFNHAYLSKIVQTLEIQLDEAEGSLKEKELRIAELETTMRSMESTQERVRSAMEQQYKGCIEMEAELQDLFKQKLEAEVQSVLIARSSKDLEDQIKLLREQNSLSGEQAQSPRMTVNVENKAVMLQGQAEKSDTLFGGEEIQKMQRGVVKFTICLSIQLVFLVLVFALFVLQLVPKSVVVVPT